MSGSTCTWRDCHAEAFVHIDKVHLCASHGDEYRAALATFQREGGRENFRAMMRAIVRAEGGAKAMTSRVFGRP